MTTTGPQALTDHQLNILFRPVNPNRVSHLRGMSHMEAWDIRRELIRVFGFGGWNLETIALDLVCERSEQRQKKNRDGKPYGDPYMAWTVVYRAQIRLTVKDRDGREIARYEDGAAGDSVNQPSQGDAHDMAMKTALSQAMKRCAVNLGDQFGLSLYNNGSTDPVVGWSVAHPPKEQAGATAPEVPEDAPVQPEPQPAPAEQETAGREQADKPAHGETPETAGPDDTPAQRIANLAAQQPADWRRYWKAGTHARAMEHEITAPDTRQRAKLGDYLTRLGKSMAEGADKERAAAIAAGQRVGLDEDTLAKEFAKSYGHPMAEGTPAELQEFAGLMTAA